jgi:hypothetical protein
LSRQDAKYRQERKEAKGFFGGPGVLCGTLRLGGKSRGAVLLLMSPKGTMEQTCTERNAPTTNITLNDEQARLLSEVVKAGAASSTEEAVDKAVRAFHSSAMKTGPVHKQVDNLADLFANSPFRGLDMTFERDKDTGRDIAL